MQTPTLAIIARREEEIRAFKPEPYWLVDATLRADRRRAGPALRGPLPRRRAAAADDGRGGRGDRRRRARRSPARSPSSRSRRKKERAPLLYDLTSLQRDANTRFGFSARRTLAAAQRLYEEHKALTYPRTNSRFLPATWSAEIKPTAGCVGTQREYAQAARLRDRPRRAAARPRRQRREGHRPPRDHPDQRRAPRRQDARRRPADLRHGRPALPRRLPSRRRVREHAPGDHGRRARLPHARPRAGRPGLARRLRRGPRRAPARATTTRAPTSSCPKLEQGEDVAHARGRLASARRPSRRGATPTRRCSAAMETAGKLVDDEELREAMKESGIGTPATRAAIIERLIDVGYIERDGRALVVHREGPQRRSGCSASTRSRRPSLTGDWEHRLGAHRARARSRASASWRDIAEFAARHGRRARRQAQGGPHPARQPRPVPGLRPRHRREPQGLLVLVARGPGLRLRDLEVQGRQDAAAGGRARADRARGAPSRPVTGFKGRSGRSFRARLALQQTEDGKWRVEFDEPWAREGAKPPEAEEAAPDGRPPRRRRLRLRLRRGGLNRS